MFYFQSDITITSALDLHTLLEQAALALKIPPLILDKSGRFEAAEVYCSQSFGIEFAMTRTEGDPPNSYHLWLESDADAIDFDGSETEVDATAYALLLLAHAGIKAEPRAHDLLYG
jgi:hypothetical protein